MRLLRPGYVLAPAIGALWTLIMMVTVIVTFTLVTGAEATLSPIAAVLTGGLAGLLLVWRQGVSQGTGSTGSEVPFLSLQGQRGCLILTVGVIVLFTVLRGGQPFGLPLRVSTGGQVIGVAALGFLVAWPLRDMLRDYGWDDQGRHAFEHVLIRFLAGFGFVVFTAAVAIPFMVMVMTSLKSQQELLANPLDFSIDLGRGWELLRSYEELFRDFNFGRYLAISAVVSVATVIITLLFSIPGAYAVSRLRFRGSAAFSRSILLIYMVPMIVLALPIYVAFSITGLRNSLIGILLIYPVTTIPVALYMLQGYFRGLPGEVEEAGLMDGLGRLAVIWKITLPLSLPALASVSLYVFMIAWNEFLLAFMLLDDPSIFTLTRGVVMLNSSEIPRQHLMAGSVLATVPVMAIFVGLERFMTRGLTAGSVKG